MFASLKAHRRMERAKGNSEEGKENGNERAAKEEREGIHSSTIGSYLRNLRKTF